MSNYTLTKLVNQSTVSENLSLEGYQLEGVGITLHLEQTAGVSYDASGGHVIWQLHRVRSSSVMLIDNEPGRATGVINLSLPPSKSALLDGDYAHSITWLPPFGDPVVLYEGVLRVDSSVASLVSEPPVQQSIELLCDIDPLGAAVELQQPPNVRCPLYVPTFVRCTVASLVTTPNATATGALVVQRNGIQIGETQFMEQSAPGQFDGAIPNSLQAEVLGEDDILSCEVFVAIFVNSVPYAVSLPMAVTYVRTGLNVSFDPILQLTSPSANASVGVGLVDLTFQCSDVDGTLSASNFVAIVDQISQAHVATILSGSGTSTVTGRVRCLISTTGAHSIGVRCTDSGGRVVDKVVAVQAVEASLSIVSPASGATVDVGPIVCSCVATPNVSQDTEVEIYEYIDEIRQYVRGIGTLGSVITTASLSAEPKELYAQISTPLGPVTSGHRTITVANQAPDITIDSPTLSQQFGVGELVVTATITHPSGAAAILPSTVRSRVGAGTWATLTRVGETDVYSGSVSTGTTEGTFNVTVEAGDASPSTSSETVSIVISRDVTWTSSVLFSSAEDTAMTAPTGDVAVNLDVTNAVNGRVHRIHFRPSTANITLDIVENGASVVADVAAAATLPTGWKFVWDAAVETSWGQTANGAVPWTTGTEYTLLLECDTATQTIRMSAEITTEVLLTGWAYRWRFDGVYDCENPLTGAAMSSYDALPVGTAPTFVADPGDDTIADRTGEVLRTTTADGCARLPVNRGAGSWTFACWIYLGADITDLANGPFGIAGCWEPSNGIWVNVDGNSAPIVTIGPATSILAHGAECYGTARASWFHFCLQFDSATGDYLFYANGRLISTQQLASNPQQQDASLGWTVGGLTGVNTPVSGGNCYAREAAVSNTLLSANQIRAHMRITAPPAQANPSIAIECLGSSMSNANELSDPLDVVMDAPYVIRGGGVGGSGSDLAWGVGAAGSFVTQLPQAIQRLGRGARTHVHHDPGLAVNAFTALNDWDVVEAAFWDEMKRMTRIGLVPFSHIMTGFASDAARGFGWRQRMLASWGAHALEFIECDWLSAIGLTNEAYYSEGIGSSGECGPHQSTTGRALVAQQISDVTITATGVV